MDLSWNGNNDPNWSHYELYILVDETKDANQNSPKYADLTYKGNDGVGMNYPSGTRVSFAMYSVMTDGSKTVQKVSVVAP